MKSLGLNWIIRLVCLFCFAIGITSNSIADDDKNEPDRLKLTTERVIVFKDGYCLVVKEGTAKTDGEGFVFTNDVPDSAILGSFWAIPEKGTIKSMVAGWDKDVKQTTEMINCTTLAEMIKANVGRECSFEIGDNMLKGKIEKLLSNDGRELPTTEENEALLLSSFMVVDPNERARRNNNLTRTTATGQYFILKTDKGDVMVKTDSVKNLTIDNMVSKIEETSKSKTIKKRLSLKFDKKNSSVKIMLMYFRPDVRWIPTYRVNLTEKDFASKNGKAKRKTAEISMQGEILNEAEDFTDVPFHVVVGVPNFRFKSTPSPMVLEPTMRTALVQAAPQIMGQTSVQGQNFDFNGMSNAMYTQRSGEFRSHRASGSGERADVNMPEELSGSGTNDLFVYKLDKMTLKKGERATVPILTTKVGYRDIYTWEVEVTHAESYAATASDANSPLVLAENRVWRQVELINDTDIPWTTGAAMFVDGYQPLAQELLTYTSPGGICRVPVTISVDLRGKATDSEVKRDLKALNWRGYNYARVNGKIEIELANNKEVKVPVEVRLRFGGKAKEASDDGKITLSTFRHEDWHNRQGDQINNSSLIEWTSEIEPGECFKPTVNYEFLLRH